MSYILDALKKAEAERHLGKLPGIHTQIAHQTMVPKRLMLLKKGRWLLILSAIVGLLVIVITIWQIGLLRPVAELAPALAPNVFAKPRMENETPFPAAHTTIPPVSPKIVSKKQASQAAPNRTEPTARSVGTASPTEASHVAKLIELPPNIQRELPPLAMSGTLYADKAADRILLIDKSMLHEGEQIAPGLVLKHILPKGAVLEYKGYFFRIGR